jgi:hypothetical protein
MTKAFLINPQQWTIKPFELSGDVHRTLTASINARQVIATRFEALADLTTKQPPYLGYFIGEQTGINCVFLCEGAYCIEDPYDAYAETSRAWFRMDFERDNGSSTECCRIVGNCLVIGVDITHAGSHLCDVTATVEELAKRVQFHWYSPQPEAAE